MESPGLDRQQPQLVLFWSSTSGQSRRIQGFLAQVLQRRRNHETFRLYQVEASEHPELVERFGVSKLPTLVLVDQKRVCGQLVAPRGCREIESFLAPWLR